MVRIPIIAYPFVLGREVVAAPIGTQRQARTVADYMGYLGVVVMDVVIELEFFFLRRAVDNGEGRCREQVVPRTAQSYVETRRATAYRSLELNAPIEYADAVTAVVMLHVAIAGEIGRASCRERV